VRNNTNLPRDLITNAYARREIEKVQLLSRGPGGAQVYVPCETLLATGSGRLRQLLGEFSLAR